MKEDNSAFATFVPRDVASRAAKKDVDAGGVGTSKQVYLDYAAAIERYGRW